MSSDDASVIALGYDLLAEKVVHVASFCILLKRSLVFSCCVHQRYWIGITALWVYEYFLTVGDEIRYIWKAPKDNIVFCLFVLNRYLVLIIITVTCVAFFSSYWTEEMCLRYGYAEQLETLVMCTIAEMLVLLRVYALSGNNRTVIICAIPLIISQWGLLFYVCSQSANGTANLTLLLGPSDVTTLPDIDAFRLCISVPPLDVVPYGQAYLCLLIVYDGLAVLAILYIVAGQSDNLHLMPILKLIQRDGLLYFAVMFTSHFVWLMLTLYAPTGLQFIQNQISSIVVSRITINLKKASDKKMTVSWRTRASRSISHSTTFERSEITDIELGEFYCARNAVIDTL
ncbi:hypothetical protein F5051DRAFT_433392 [Lentinula edodes]|nr:hypothetical protein F5051DRAFT_433392 [Lentinula edodes]